MNKPKFDCGSLSVEIEHPSDWSVTDSMLKADNRALNGNLFRDIMGRTFSYSLIYDAMTLADFELLEDLYNYHRETQDLILFTYGKWRQSQAGVYVVMELSNRKRKLGSGDTFYFQSLTITLDELTSRL